MTKFEQIPDLPTSSAYVREIFHLTSEQCIGDGNAIIQEAEKRRQADLGFRNYLGRIAEISSQVETLSTSDTTSPDPDNAIKHAFNNGTVFGTFLAERVHKGAINYQDILLALPLPMVSDSPTRAGRRRDAALPYLENGARGVDLFLDQRSTYLIEPLESRVVSDMTKRQFFRTGIGLILLSADSAHRTKLGMSPSTSVDWDQALKNLLDNDD